MCLVILEHYIDGGLNWSNYVKNLHILLLMVADAAMYVRFEVYMYIYILFMYKENKN